MSKFNNKKGGKFNRGNENKQLSVQDGFLKYISANKTPITVFLVCGVRLQGIVTHFDTFSLLLRREGHSQLVFKHAVSTIMPIDPIQFWEEDTSAASAPAPEEEVEGEDDEVEKEDDSDED